MGEKYQFKFEDADGETGSVAIEGMMVKWTELTKAFVIFLRAAGYPYVVLEEGDGEIVLRKEDLNLTFEQEEMIASFKEERWQVERE
jgi:hypothetical protein